MAGMMEGKVAVVTGSGGGIGREIAIAMAAAGARVIVCDVGASLSGEGGSSTPAQQTKQLIEQKGGAAEICTESVSEWGSAQKIVQAALDHYGRIDAVVNNAGILRDVIFHKMTPEDWLSVISVHLNGSFFVSRAAAEHYRKQESGTFVHISSTSGLIGNFGQANYSAAKLGITALSKSIALDMKRYNVRSNCIAPFAWSRMTQSIPATTPEQQARLAKIQAMTPDKNAPMAVYLSSDAAKDVTGQVFGTRMNEIILFSSPRPIRIVHRAEGWTPETIADHAAAGAEGRLHAAGSLRRGVQLGSALSANRPQNSSRGAERHGNPGRDGRLIRPTLTTATLLAAPPRATAAAPLDEIRQLVPEVHERHRGAGEPHFAHPHHLLGDPSRRPNQADKSQPRRRTACDAADTPPDHATRRTSPWPPYRNPRSRYPPCCTA